MTTIADSAVPLEATVKWLPGWYASRLHTLPANNVQPGQQPVKSLCGEYVYGKAQTDWAQRRIDKGVPHCKRCEKMLTPNAKLTSQPQ